MPRIHEKKRTVCHRIKFKQVIIPRKTFLFRSPLCEFIDADARSQDGETSCLHSVYQDPPRLLFPEPRLGISIQSPALSPASEVRN